MAHRRFRIVLAGAAAFPATAFANSGIGFFMPASIFLALAVIPVILVEAPLLWWRLRVPPLRSLSLSVRANLSSTLVGAVIGAAFDIAVGLTTGMSGFAGLEGILIALVPLFGITWWVEYKVVRRAERDIARPKVLGATLLANVVSYALLAALAIATISRDPTLKRARMTEVVNVAMVARVDAAEQYQAMGRFRASRQEAPTRHVRRVTTEESGRIVAEIAYPKDEELDGKTLVMEPEVRDGKLVAWHCYVPEAPFKYFPASCRNRDARGSP